MFTYLYINLAVDFDKGTINHITNNTVIKEYINTVKIEYHVHCVVSFGFGFGFDFGFPFAFLFGCGFGCGSTGTGSSTSSIWFG